MSSADAGHGAGAAADDGAPDRARRLRLLVGVVATLAVLLLVGVVAARSLGGGGEPYVAPDGTVIDGVQAYEDLSRDHVGSPDYTDPVPPVGGAHLDYWQDCGFYAEPVEDGAGVHSLEHGAVWVTYDPDLPDAEVAELQQLAADNPYLLVSPRADLPSAVVASAWGVQLRLGSVDDERLPVFLTTFQQGPQTPEPGAPCTGGETGTTVADA